MSLVKRSLYIKSSFETRVYIHRSSTSDVYLHIHQIHHLQPTLSNMLLQVFTSPFVPHPSHLNISFVPSVPNPIIYLHIHHHHLVYPSVGPFLPSFSRPHPIKSQIPNRAPLVPSANFTLHSLFSPKHHISPPLPKQKFATPPSIKILPTNIPPSFHTLIPSPHPAYTLPWTSHLMPSGAPVSA